MPLTLKQKIKLVKSYKENCLTPETVKNLLNQIIPELLEIEEYELCGELKELEKEITEL